MKINNHYPSIDVDETTLGSIVKFLTTIHPSRNYLNLQSLEKAANYIERKFIEYGLKTETQPFVVNGNNYKNVIGSTGIDRPIRIIIGAHYDVFENQSGADDNASAIAGLLEVARIMHGLASKMKYRLDFVAYSLEEPPFFGTDKMGSYIHAKSMYERGVDIRGMICLEMIGFFTDKKRSQEYPFKIMKLFYPTQGDFIGVVGNFKSRGMVKEVKRYIKATSIETRTLIAPSWIKGVDFSDQRNYWEFGYDAVMITDTSFYRNPNYHKITDTMESLDFGKMKKVVEGIILTLINMK